MIDEILFARDVLQGRASNTEMGIRAGAHALPVVGGAVARVVGRTESRMARVSRLGREGKEIAGITGPKIGIRMNGRMRFPDGLDRASGVLTEVKNVRYQGYSRQLRDSVEYAQARGYRVDLFVRQGTTISRPLAAAELRGEINILRRLPNPR